MQTVHQEGGGRTQGLISNSDSDILPLAPSPKPMGSTFEDHKTDFPDQRRAPGMHTNSVMSGLTGRILKISIILTSCLFGPYS